MDSTAGSDSVFRPYVPTLVATWRAEAGETTLRALDCSLVSIDISGFTALSERLAERGRAGAEELILLISRYYAELIDAAVERGGDVLKFRGDALLLAFRGDGHELRACRAALEMQRAIDRAGAAESSVGAVTLRMAVGIHSAEAFFLLVGSKQRELLVVGPSATATLVLEDLAEGGEVLVSAGTAEALPPGSVGESREHAWVLLRDAPLGDPRTEGTRDGDAALRELIPPQLRTPIAAGAVEAEHRHAVAAFVKFAGTDALVDDPDALAAAVAELARLVGESAAEHGVTWLESDVARDGGKLYLVAGAPASAGGDEERMLRTLRTIVDARPPVAVSAGVNRGWVFAGEIGSAARRTYAVMGDTVNVAARLAERAPAGVVLASSAVLDRSRARFDASPQPHLVKGREGSVRAFEVGALLESADVADRPLPLVGRERELSVFASALDAARRRERQVVELVGEAGIGKSRLVEELRARATGFQQLVVRCEEYEASTPFFAFRSLLRPLVGITPELGAAEAGEQLVAWAHAVVPELGPWLPLLAIPFDAEVPSTPETTELDPAFRQARLHEVLDEFLQRMLLVPTLLVFEDAHWMDDASAFFVRHLLSRTVPLPWLVCLTRLPEAPSLVGPGGRYLELEPLDPEAAMQLAVAAAGETTIAPADAAALAARSGGNPLFVRELVAARSVESEDLPETVESVITARIDRLDPVDRLLLRCASVIGPSFDLDLLAEVLSGEIDELTRDRIDRLGEFVAWEDDELRFRHELFRSVAYEGLSYRRRRHLHRLVGEALERTAAGQGEETAPRLSLHFFEAGEHDQAWGYAVVAADRAREMYANVDAAELYERALAASAHLTPDPHEVARVAEALGDVAELAAHYDRADAAYEQAFALVEGTSSTASRLLQKRGVLCERRGAYDDGLAFYARGLEQLGDDADDVATRAQIELAYAGVRYRQGEYADAIAWSTRAAAHAERAGTRDALAHAYYLLGIARLQTGDRETTFLDLALPIFEEMGDVAGQGNVLNNLGIAAYYEGRWDAAVDFYRRAHDAQKRAGNVVRAANATNNVAEILLDRGRVGEAEESFREALRVYRGAGYVFGAAVATANLGRVAAYGSQFDEAHVLLAEAVRELDAIGATSFRLDAEARVAECFVLEGRHRDALERATVALEATHAGGADVGLPLLERLVGYALHQGRRPDEARAHFEESLRLARSMRSPHETALSLRALAETGAREHRAESDALLARLGVVGTPRIPLP